MTGLAFCLYAASAAPGLTWANSGADGGDLLAAAMTNGIPHPTGYPLYTLLLQGWLGLLGWLLPASEIAWRGNLFSAACAALSVGCAALLAWRLGEQEGRPHFFALLGGGAWMAAPLLWGQAQITEVYGLHAALLAALGWLLLAKNRSRPLVRGMALGALLGLGLAHHLTIGLLLPGIFYWLWSEPERPLRQPTFWLGLAAGTLPGLLLYGRLLWWVNPDAPVLWGGGVGTDSLWWLVSGEAYRRYLFAVPVAQWLPRISHWAWTITTQWTPVGLAFVLTGFYRWDSRLPRMGRLALLWVLPVSLYAIGYNTADSEIYLLPVVWLMALALPFGVQEAVEWLAARWLFFRPPALAISVGIGLLLLVALRYPAYTLVEDGEARRFVQSAAAVLERGSLVFSSGDAETFALWYGVWASGELEESAPGTVYVNVALLQFEWYQAQLQRQYPHLPGVESGSAQAILQANTGLRPIFFSEVIGPATADQLTPAGLLWRYQPREQSRN